MGSRRFSLALEHISGNGDANKPITAFLIDKSYANYENSNPCLKEDGVRKNMQLKKSRSAPVINGMIEQTCRLQSDEDKVFAMVPRRRFSICDLNTFDNELPGITQQHASYGKAYSSEPATCPPSSISEEDSRTQVLLFLKSIADAILWPLSSRIPDPLITQLRLNIRHI